MSRYPLGVAYISIMCLRHSIDHMGSQDRRLVINTCTDHVAALARTIQEKASRVLSGEEGGSAVSVIKPMTRLLANSLEIVHFVKEKMEGEQGLEKVCVAMFEFVAYHVAKVCLRVHRGKFLTLDKIFPRCTLKYWNILSSTLALVLAL